MSTVLPVTPGPNQEEPFPLKPKTWHHQDPRPPSLTLACSILSSETSGEPVGPSFGPYLSPSSRHKSRGRHANIRPLVTSAGYFGGPVHAGGPNLGEGTQNRRPNLTTRTRPSYWGSTPEGRTSSSRRSFSSTSDRRPSRGR